MTDIAINGARKVSWTLVAAVVGWCGLGLVAWGSTTAQVTAHDKRIEKLELTAATDKDLSGLSLRLSRIEAQLDELLRIRRSPQ